MAERGVGGWDAIDEVKYADEDAAVRALLAANPLTGEARQRVAAEALALVRGARTQGSRHGVVESFLKEFSLGTREGLALMCLAEALLRTPDADTRDRLIAEKIASADWRAHLGKSDSLFVNASTWGLMLTGRVVEVDPEARRDTEGWLNRLTRRVGEPVIREAVGAAVGLMGNQFVLGRTIDEALARARREGMLCSFDMLGEGARTDADARRYESLYAAAIEAVGRDAQGAGPERGHGVSVKLSALCARYEATQSAFVHADLYPRLLRLATLAAKHDLNFAIDAEEADRLVLSLELVDRLTLEPALAGWEGLGVVVQAYQKRGLAVIEGLARLAATRGRRLMIRLVKGAYWDTEVKRAQVAGRPDYPVFTTKAATDLHYLVCAKALIDAAPALYPQFATHNAHTLAAVQAMARDKGVRIESQRLHGMGEALYAAAAARGGEMLVRAYAPVGGHEDLLPYLVRRLLENGANSSFVHALTDEAVPAEQVAQDPVALVEAQPHRHPRIPRPAELYGAARRNPPGRDYSMARERERIAAAVAAVGDVHWYAGPLIAGQTPERRLREMRAPADHARVIGSVSDATEGDLDTAVKAARAAQPAWDASGGRGRAKVLRAMADALEGATDRLVALLALEGGKTLNDGVAEVREAIDFCRYYAGLAEQQFDGFKPLPGPVGETNALELRGRGAIGCISPWNFPLAIFTGQIAAALAAGNAAIAKPAEQTPLIAHAAVTLFHQAGLDPALLSLLPGDGAVIGAALTKHPGIDGIAFTGGTDTAAAINRTLAARPGPIIPFVAETGGLNAMLVDTTALREQVVDDVILSALGSAGQRCSALRMVLLPHDTADAIIETLVGALARQVVGPPWDPATDIGPVIDAEAHAALSAHVARLEAEGRVLARAEAPGSGSYFAPTIAEVPSPDWLEREVFGPILHVCRYDPAELEAVCAKIAARGYGLTLGIHTRIENFSERVRAMVPAGNVYVNRAMTGAVVGVQPFGGEGLSGTGPKAGGPHALLRFAVERTLTVNIAAQGGDPSLLNL